MGKATYGRRADGSVERPAHSWECWALKRLYVGSLAAQYVHCSKPPRRGCLTCHWHQHLEAKAQRRLDDHNRA